MASIFEQALGTEFHKLHPRIQQRFGFSSKDRVASIGRGVMDRVWFSKWAAIPLQIGATRHILFPQGGSQIPFTVENFTYLDSFGRETMTWIRKFKFYRKVRRFDATMIYSRQRQGVIDYLGNKQHLAVDLSVSTEPNGGIRIRSGDQRFYEGFLQFRFPRPLTGTADVCEWYDDREEQYKISVEVHNPLIGLVFQYRGTFQAHFLDTQSSTIPMEVKPLREERRE